MTPHKLMILTTQELAGSEELLADAAKGHEITVDTKVMDGLTLADYDLIMAPNAFRVRLDLLKYRELAYKEVRAAARAAKKGKVK